jgi:spore coat protein H
MYGLNIDPANPKGNPTIAELRSLGVKAVRYSYKDASGGSQLDPQRLRFYADHLQGLTQANIDALIILTYETYPGAPIHPVSDQVWDNYIAAFAQRAGQLAQALAPLRPTFQVWNEPDLPPHPEYIRTMPEAVFGRMLRRTYDAIKAAAPPTRVITAGLGSGNWNWLANVISSQKGTLPADAIAIHPYGQRPEPAWPSSTWGFGYVGNLILNYQRVTNLPIVISEIGEQHLDRPQQAEYLWRFYRTITGQFSGSVERVCWFCYSDGMVPPFGLLDINNSPKPAYQTFRTLANAAPPERQPGLMTLTAIVNKADYDNMVRNPAQKLEIAADIRVDGALYRQGEISYRGTTSLNFPKKGFKIKFSKKQLYQGNTRRIDLSGSYSDKSLIRERLSFDLFAKTKTPASKAWHVDYTIRSREGQVLERGVYTGLEHLDEYYFRNHQREIGSLFQANGGVINGVYVGANLTPQPPQVLPLLYEKDHPEDEDFSDLDAFIRAINSWDAATIAQFLDQILDVDPYLDWLAVNTLVQSNDTYHKNYFLHHRPGGGKWEILPWDYDLTWGRNWNDYCDGLCDDLSEGTSIKGSNQMNNSLSQRVLNNPTYYTRLLARLNTLLSSEFTEEKLFPKIDAYYNDIRALVYQDPKKWPTNEQFEQERDRLKDWIRRRRAFLFKELGAPPPGQLADTVVAAVGFGKPTLVEGEAITFEATVRNIGGAITGGIVGVAFLIDGNYITFGTSPTLEAGGSRVIKAVAPWTAIAGEHTLTAIVDDINRYPEASETNNTLAVKFQVERKPAPGLADTIIRDIAFERLEGGQVRLAALVANVGTAETAAQVGVAFFVDDKYTTFGIISPLPAGEAKPVRAQQALNLTGVRKITAIVDDVNRYPEQNEQNNLLVKQINFGEPGPAPLADTIILSLSLGQGRFNEGDMLTFEALVRNIGTAATGDVVGVAFLINGQQLTFGTTTALAAGETRAVRAVTPWRAVAGRHRLTAIVDDVNRYPELSEANNSLDLEFQVFPQSTGTLPDSTLDAIGFERDSSGQVILTATVSNVGGVPTPDVVGVAFFVNGQYTTYGITPPMAPGATQLIRAVKALPLAGKQTITAIVDDINRYEELSTQNNALTREITF